MSMFDLTFAGPPPAQLVVAKATTQSSAVEKARHVRLAVSLLLTTPSLTV